MSATTLRHARATWDALNQFASEENVGAWCIRSEAVDQVPGYGNGSGSTRTRYGFTGPERDPLTDLLYHRKLLH